MSIKSKIQSLIAAANAKTGESDATLTDAVQTLVDGYGQGGGGEDLLEKRITRQLTSYSNSNITNVGAQSFYQYSPLASIDLPNVTTVGAQAFQGCSSLSAVYFPLATIGSNGLANCSKLVLAVIGSVNSDRAFSACAKLQVADIALSTTIRTRMFESCSALNTIIMRSATLNAMNIAPTDVFRSCPNFLSGGSGGTIYIPKSLYDHLGDGSSSDYKAATNWSTLNGYGTVTWAKIEGSIYETQYADGTPIT